MIQTIMGVVFHIKMYSSRRAGLLESKYDLAMVVFIYKGAQLKSLVKSRDRQLLK